MRPAQLDQADLGRLRRSLLQREVGQVAAQLGHRPVRKLPGGLGARRLGVDVHDRHRGVGLDAEAILVGGLDDVGRVLLGSGSGHGSRLLGGQRRGNLELTGRYLPSILDRLAHLALSHHAPEHDRALPQRLQAVGVLTQVEDRRPGRIDDHVRRR